MKTVRILGAICLILLEVVALNAHIMKPTYFHPTDTIIIENKAEDRNELKRPQAIINLSVRQGRVATEEEVSGLPENLQEQILKSPAGIKPWPVPEDCEVQVLLEGLKKGTEVMVYNRRGFLIQSFDIQPNEPVLLETLKTGIYFLRTAHKEIPTIRLLVH